MKVPNTVGIKYCKTNSNSIASIFKYYITIFVSFNKSVVLQILF